MIALELLHTSKQLLSEGAPVAGRPLSLDLFGRGGGWMQGWMQHWDNGREKPARKADFRIYGWGKYLLCSLALVLSAFWLWRWHPLLALLAPLVFYLVEVHFLFLFPLLIDGAEHPVLESIRMTYRIGLFRAWIQVMSIGGYMMLGLLSISDPFKNWYRGCLAVLIWYRHEAGAGK